MGIFSNDINGQAIQAGCSSRFVLVVADLAPRWGPEGQADPKPAGPAEEGSWSVRP